MRADEIISTFDEKGIHVFSTNDIMRLTGKSKGYVGLMLSRLTKRGLIYRALRGHYYTGRAGVLEIASGLVSPSYVSLMSAFYYYGFLPQQPNSVDVMASRRHRTLEVGNAKIRFHTLPRYRIFGYSRDKEGVFIAQPEKAVIDSLYLKSPQYGYVEEAFIKAVSKGLIDTRKLSRYAHMMDSEGLVPIVGALIKKAGRG